MAVKHLRFHGTFEEVTNTLASIPTRKTDRLLESRPIFAHMNQHLGVEIWEACLSKVELTPTIMDVVHRQAKKYPNMLYRVTDKHNRVFHELKPGEYCNYNEQDSAFPGPFGALCKRYGKSYY